MSVDVSSPKGPNRVQPETLPQWAREQLSVASDILADPGGGLLFATQTIGQVRAGLGEADAERWLGVIEALHRAEDAAIRRDYARARQLVGEAITAIS